MYYFMTLEEFRQWKIEEYEKMLQGLTYRQIAAMCRIRGIAVSEFDSRKYLVNKLMNIYRHSPMTKLYNDYVKTMKSAQQNT